MSHDDYSAPVHQSLVRPMLLMGGERTLVLMLAVISGVFILSLHAIWAAIAGVLLWIVGMFALSRAGAYDPQLSKVGPRSLRYRKFYPAAATPHAQLREIK